MLDKFSIDSINPRLNEWWAGVWPSNYVERGRYLYDHELVVFSQGTTQVLVGDRSFICSKGDVLIIPPGIRHWSRAVNVKVERYCLHFDWTRDRVGSAPSYAFEGVDSFNPEFCEHAPDWLELEMPFYSSDFSLSTLTPLLRQLTTKDRSSWFRLRQRGLFIQLLSELFRHEQNINHPKGSFGKSLRLVQGVKQRIENDFRKPLKMRSIAREFNVTAVHMTRAFRIHVGMSPVEYLHHLRLAEARSLLSTSSMNIAEIASHVGFDDANYFSRIFKKKIGVAPSQFMDMHAPQAQL